MQHPFAMPPSVRVPTDYRGVWVRTRSLSSADPAGAKPSDASPVWARWLQTSLWHAELHVPHEAMVGRVAAPLSTFDSDQLAALTHQRGVAGCTRVDAHPQGELCSWLRRIDYQPPSLSPDAAWVVFDAPHRMVRIDQHSELSETWERLPDSLGVFRVLSGVDDRGQPDGRLLLQAGVHLCLVRDRRRPWPRGLNPGLALVDVLLAQPEHAIAWLDQEVSFGRLDGAHWCIERSTLPEREGLRLPCSMVRWRVSDEADVTLGADTSRWQVLEWTDDLA
jgi:hypothetical protein